MPCATDSGDVNVVVETRSKVAGLLSRDRHC